MAAQILTQAILKQRFSYDASTGLFVWRERDPGFFPDLRAWKSWNSRYAGNPAGTINGNGYRQVNITGKLYMAHRLAWLYVYGEFPGTDIDHINHDKLDNRIANLRLATPAENRRNLPLRATSKSGVPGVYWLDQYRCWYPSIRVGGKTINLSYTKDFFEAVCARKSAENRHGFHGNHGRPG